MTRVMSQLSNTQQNNSNKLFQEQCKTEMEIKQKNINKLIFVQSDDQNSEDQRVKKKLSQTSQMCRLQENQFDLRVRKKRSLSKQFKGDSKLLKPSIMKSNADNQEDYEHIINYQNFQLLKNTPQSKTNKIRRLKTIKKNLMFQELIEKRDMFRESKVNQQQPSISIMEGQIGRKYGPKKEQNESRERIVSGQQIVIPKLQIASIYFQMSDQEPQDACFTQTNIRPEQFNKKQLEQSEMAQKSNVQNPNESQNPEKSEEKTQVIESVDITQLVFSAKIMQRSLYLQQLLKNWTFNEEKILNLMLSPLLPGTRQVFQLHVSSTLTQKSYILWLDMGQQMKLMMKADKLLTLSKTTFEFHTFDPKLGQYLQTCTMSSNIDRSLFNMYKIEGRNKKKRLLATYSQTINIKNNKLIVMYFPRFGENNEAVYFYEESYKKDLQMIYRQNQIQQIDYVMSTKMETEKKKKMMDFYNLRPSEKSIEFKNSNGSMQVIIGKKQSKRYQIISAPGLSPLQIFGLAIVQIQT